ncbi:ketimine reductase mu-crystallin [Agrilus planipennis]|uniref:Ketimine reductase mu-crystallin n=1 Tax=Agrilus planipennis TaxID=224129 RepID=A0A1W4X0Z5_AGRPL|nr:ketimine reductase mu-crystallin [Agrilus planipennis]XP_018326443.1 ketimine reductase mu-crystallin [Agrilus planipennis]
MSSSLVYLSEERVRQLLNWDSTFDAIERAMMRVSERRAVQNPRTFTMIPHSGNLLLTMPGYLDDSKYGSLGCKLVTAFPDNVDKEAPLPSIVANIMLLDENSGQLKAVVAGTEVTKWRTAAASAVATKYILKNDVVGKDQILAIIGAGEQGKIHAIAFQYFFGFKEVRVWNRTIERANQLKSDLEQTEGFKGRITVHENVESCVKDADVIVTATFSDCPLVKYEWLKEGVHINAVGAGQKHHSELEESIYLNADVFVDYLAGAKKELSGLERISVKFKGEVGDIITGMLKYTEPKKITIFQSLGMAVEDTAMARLLYDLHMKEIEEADNQKDKK